MNSQQAKGLIGKIQHFMGSYRGKVILNYAYSWGAAIVILGALFKLTHVPGANMMLWIGMGTEVAVFFISAFDLPVRQRDIRPVTPSEVEEPTRPSRKAYEQPIVPSASLGVTEIAASINIPPDMENITTNYLNELKETTETLSRLNAQMQNTFQDTDQLTSMNRSLSGINAMWDIQLKNLSSQIGTVDQVHEQIRKMARQIEELNAIYARMLEAMNTNGK